MLTHLHNTPRSAASHHPCLVCVHLAAGLCNGSKTRVLVSFELRSSAVKQTFLQEAEQAFSQVRGMGSTGGSVDKQPNIVHNVVRGC